MPAMDTVKKAAKNIITPQDGTDALVQNHFEYL